MTNVRVSMNDCVASRIAHTVHMRLSTVKEDRTYRGVFSRSAKAKKRETVSSISVVASWSPQIRCRFTMAFPIKRASPRRSRSALLASELHLKRAKDWVFITHTLTANKNTEQCACTYLTQVRGPPDLQQWHQSPHRPRSQQRFCHDRPKTKRPPPTPREGRRRPLPSLRRHSIRLYRFAIDCRRRTARGSRRFRRFRQPAYNRQSSKLVVVGGVGG